MKQEHLAVSEEQNMLSHSDDPSQDLRKPRTNGRGDLLLWGFAAVLLVAVCLLATLGTADMFPLSVSYPDVSETPSSAPFSDAVSDDGKIDLNTATLDDLVSVYGIGEVLANRILEYRDRYGEFSCVEDLMNVTGIGEARFAILAPYFTVGSGK